jgi:adenosylmethionine-8-amino-7-oxononanoate aminotransferase
VAAVQLEPELVARDAGVVAKLAAAVRRQGVILRPLAREIALSPPLVCEDEHVELIGAAIRAALEEV